MLIIKLDATDSTNLYLKKLLLSEPIDNLTVVVANKQFKARGQMGTVWQSVAGKNLTFSILKQSEGFVVQNQFYLNIAVSLAVYALLNVLKTPDISIKWPNDILSGNQKICGILIENILQGQLIKASIIGVGLNVNQTDFHTLFNATSLKLLLGEKFNLEKVLDLLLKKLRHYFNLLDCKDFKGLKNAYLATLYKRGEIANFLDVEDNPFTGNITDVTPEGRLVILLNNGILKTYGMKEIKLVY